MHNECMPTMTIRNVPEETLAELKDRAARSGRSLQEYVRGTLIDISHRPDLEVWLDENERRKGLFASNVSVEDIIAARDEGRR